MTRVIWVKYPRWFNAQMFGRKVLLLVDNLSSHISSLEQVKEEAGLRNTRVEFLPTNTTSKFQPLDQGIIRNLKLYYRRQWLEFIMEVTLKQKKDPWDIINLLDIIRWIIHTQRHQVKEETITNCWRHIIFFGEQFGPKPKPIGQDEEEVKLVELTKIVGIEQLIKMSDFISPPGEDLQDADDLIESLAKAYSPEEEEEDDGEEETQLITIAEAISSLRVISLTADLLLFLALRHLHPAT